MESLVRVDSTSPLASKDMFITAWPNASSQRNKAFPGERWYFKYSTGELDYCSVNVNKNCATNITFTLIHVFMSFESVLSVRHLQSFLTRKKNNFLKTVTRALMINVLECTNSKSQIKCSIKAKKQTTTNELKYIF